MTVVHNVRSLSPFIGSDNKIACDEHEMVRRLTDADYNGRDDALEWLKESIRKCEGSCVTFSNPLSVFQGLSAALEDDEWDTRYQCVKVVGDLIPLLDSSDIEQCMQEVLPTMIQRFGDVKITVSTAAISALIKYAQCANSDIQILCDSIVLYGLKADDERLRLSVTESVPSLLEASHDRIANLDSLVSSLIELTFDAHFMQPVEKCLCKIARLYIGTGKFDACISRLPSSVQEQYHEIQNDGTAVTDMFSEMSVDHDSSEVSTKAAALHVSHQDSTKLRASSEKSDVLYGFIPSKVVNNLSNRDDNRSLSRAIEELRTVVSENQKYGELEPHMSDFLNFLSRLLEDGVSFQVL